MIDDNDDKKDVGVPTLFDKVEPVIPDRVSNLDDVPVGYSTFNQMLERKLNARRVVAARHDVGGRLSVLTLGETMATVLPLLHSIVWLSGQNGQALAEDIATFIMNEQAVIASQPVEQNAPSPDTKQ